MSIGMRAVSVNVGKVILTAVVMIGLSLFFATLPGSLADPSASPDELAEAASRLGWIGWMRLSAIYLIAILVAATLSGVLFAGSRWIVRLAVIVTVLIFCLDPIGAAMYFSREGLDTGIVKYMIVPLAGIGVMAFLLAPFFHDLGRISRDYLQHRGKAMLGPTHFTDGS